MPTDTFANVINVIVEHWFANCDENVKTIILEVLIVEWENISMERPRVKDQIDEIISQVAQK